jgi:hypothetical protein
MKNSYTVFLLKLFWSNQLEKFENEALKANLNNFRYSILFPIDLSHFSDEFIKKKSIKTLFSFYF